MENCLMSECGESGEIHFILFDDDDVDDDDDDARKNVPFRRECGETEEREKDGVGVVGGGGCIYFLVNIEFSMQCRATHLSSPLLTRCVFFLRFPLSPNIYNI